MSIDDPLLKELLAALKEDTQRMRRTFLALSRLMLSSQFSPFLAVVTFVRIILFPLRFRPGPDPGLIETTLTLVLFALSVVSIYNLPRLRERYARLQALAEKLGR